ncbi:MAG TPA: hypothetical protein VGG44_04805, partial [Tepidisphaeraceae bacterium]
PFADPIDTPAHFHPETLWRLPHTNWCYPEVESSPAVETAPVNRQGHITFGSFNNFAKLSDAMLQLWCKILRQVPGSRLMLKSSAFKYPSTKVRIHRAFAEQDIDIARLSLIGLEASHANHLAMYNQMDIALDTFPYHGTTTTCDALWMGVPVVTLAGDSHVSRVGTSLLNSVGLPQCVAATRDEYAKIAVDLAGSRARLQALRQTLRAQMQTSPLMNAAEFARDVEKAYRQMWQKWITRAPTRG